ncbi:MAG: methyltransferase domain-containing protein [Phycisphaeraceae bacterium]|nr:methyltransferase domain-containing protein [Phycisphaeraceae bacterium]
MNPAQIDTVPSGRTWDAGDYAAHSSGQQKWAMALMDRLQLRGDEAVLDIGCGDGKVTAQIAALVPRGHVVGIDQSRQMIEFARRNHGQVANLTFELGDARSLAYASQFDLVFSNACLHWVVDHGPVLAGIARALRPRGRFALSMGGRGGTATVIRVVESLIQQDRWRDFFRGFEFPYGFYGPDDYRRWAQEAGLAIDRAELVPKDMVHHSAEEMAGWIRTTWLPYTQRVPESQRPGFVAEVVRAYLDAHPADVRGDIHVPMIRLEIEGHKPPRHDSNRS